VKLTVFNGSPRGKGGNTKLYLDHFLKGYETSEGNTYELAYLNHVKNQDKFVQMFKGAENVLIAFPLYCDAMPAMVKTFIESLEPLCGRKDNPSIGFIVQGAFPEAHQYRYVERYLKKLALRLGCNYFGTVVKGQGHGANELPKSFKKPFAMFYKLGQIFGKTGEFDTELLRKLAGPEKLSKLTLAIFGLLYKTKIGTKYWDDRLKKNSVYEKRFDRPYVTGVK
jgi:multimeric flavodoxin WrbA